MGLAAILLTGVAAPVLATADEPGQKNDGPVELGVQLPTRDDISDLLDAADGARLDGDLVTAQTHIENVFGLLGVMGLESTDPLYFDAYSVRASIRLDGRNGEGAEEDLVAAIKVADANDISIFEIERLRAIALEQQGKLAESEAIYLKLLKEPKGEKPAMQALLLVDLGTNLEKQGKLKEAEATLLKAIALLEEADDQLSLGYATMTLGHIALARGELADARKYYTAAIKGRELAFGKTHTAVATAWNNLCQVEALAEAWDAAEEACRQAIEIRQGQLADDHPYLLATLSDYAAILRKLGRDDEAAKIELRLNQ